MLQLANNTNGSSGGRLPAQDPFHNVYPTLVECFGIIFLGYLAGRAKIISPMQARGLEIYAVSAALPASILKFMIELDFGLVNWELWLSLLLSKLVLFILVGVVTLLLTRPVDFGRAGIYGLFVTQSNDLALGLPLFTALYRNSKENYCQYIYLLIPVSFGLLCPMGFLLLEYEKSRNLEGKAATKCRIMLTVLKKIVTNPLVYTVVIGLGVNFWSGHEVPEILKRCLEVLANSFAAIALFCLGLKIIGSTKNFNSHKLILPVMLIIAKSIVLPFICKETTYFITKYATSLNATEVTSMSAFAFLYGTLPTAPTVVMYAAKYSTAAETVAASMVLGTILSAPIMFISAKMMVIQMMTELRDLILMISTAVFDVSILSVVCCIWVFVVFLVGKQLFSFPHQWTSCLVLSQLLIALSPLVGAAEVHASAFQQFVVWIFYFGYLSVIFWTALLAATLAYVRWRGEAAYDKRLKIATPVIGFGLPGLLSLALAISSVPRGTDLEFSKNKFIDSFKIPAFNITSIVALLGCLTITLVSLMVLHRRDRYCTCDRMKVNQEEHTGTPDNAEDDSGSQCANCKTSDGRYQSISTHVHKPFCHTHCVDVLAGGSQENNKTNEWRYDCVEDIEDLLSLNGDSDQAELLTRVSVINLSDLEDNLITLKQFRDGGKHQISRHIMLLILLSITNLLSIFLCFWRLFGSMIDGVYLEVQFLASVLTFGQGFLAFAMFGFKKELFVSPTTRRFMRFHMSCLNRRIQLPPIENLEPDDLRICQQFRTHHLERCKGELVRNLRFHLKSYHDVFRGDEFVSWLVSYGLVEDRDAAVRYGNSLLVGQVLKHCVEEHYFDDQPFFYTFNEEEEEESTIDTNAT